jgi:hypothetical protein
MRSVVVRNAKLAVDEDALVQRPNRTVLARHRARSRAVHKLDVHRAGAHAHLAALVHHSVAGGAAVRRVRGRAVEFVLDEAVVRVFVSGCDDGFVDDAGPDGGQWEEDARYGQDLHAEVGDGFLD